MSVLAVVLLVVLVLMLLGAAPVHPYSRDWGPYPVSGVFLLLLVVLILVLMGVF
jgi:hypothetical protein